MRVVLDTNVLGASFTPSEPLHRAAIELLQRLHDGNHSVFLPAAVVAELGVDFLQRGAEVRWTAFLDELRREERYRVIPLGIELADRTARLRGETRLKLADAMIGASALSVGAELLVSEDPDLKRLRGHLKVEDIRRALKVLKSS